MGGAPTPAEVEVEEGNPVGDASLVLQEELKRMEIDRKKSVSFRRRE